MLRLPYIFVVCLCAPCVFHGKTVAQTSEAEDWLKDVDTNVTRLARQMTSAEWNFFTHVTDVNRLATRNVSNVYSLFGLISLLDIVSS